MKALILLLLLVSSAAAEKLRIAVFGDRTHGADQAVFERMVASADRMRPDLLINTGDNIEGYTSDWDGARAEWKLVKDTSAKLSCPVWYTPGNHDIWDDESEKLWKEEVGHDANYSFDVGEVHFTIVDNSRTEEFAQVPDAQVAWLRDDLAKAAGARHRFVFMHKPFWYAALDKGQEDGLHKVLREGKATRVFTGHYHGFCYREIDGIPYHITGSVGGENSKVAAKGDFYGFLWVTVDGDRVDAAILGPDGVMPQDAITYEQREAVGRVQHDTIGVQAVDLPETEGPAEVAVSVSFTPQAEGGVGSEARWDTSGTAWTADPPSEPITAAKANGGLAASSAMVFHLRVKDAREPFPLPTIRMTYRYLDRLDVPVEASLVVRRMAKAPRVEKAPVLDGVLDDGCWSDASRLGGLSAISGMKGVVGETAVWVVRDGERLYVAARCDDPEPKRIRAFCKQRDSIAIISDDSIAIALDPTNERNWAYQVMVNAAGTLFDLKTSFPPAGQVRDPRWNAPWEAKTARTETGWTVELSVPLEALGSSVDEGTTWAFNVGRYCPRQKGALAWQPSTTAHPSTYGTLVLQ